MRKTFAFVGVCTFLALSHSARYASGQEQNFAKQRSDMVRLIEQRNSTSGDSTKISDNVLDAMRKTKRHLFVPEKYRSLAYADRPVSIGRGQTISQPYVVALMTQLAELNASDIVLEVGTGSGYQAAILSRLVKKVCTIEIVASLGEEAKDRLSALGYKNVSVRIGDGYAGWPACSPFDAIVVTAALDHVPPPLIEQMKVGGRMVMPIGPVFAAQQLTVVEKTGPDTTKTHFIAPVRFVPFTRRK